MSINSALNAGVSALTANSAALATISDNIANSNTIGYKTVDTEFGDIVTNSNLYGDYDAGGVLASTRQLVSTQGNLQQTSTNTDLAISGQGMFVTTSVPNPTVTDTRNFTRAGSFTLNNTGYLENASGQYLQGWPVNADGTVTTDPTSLNALQTINVGDVGGTATPTTTMALNANLNAAQTVNPAVDAYSASSASTSMAAYDADNGTGTKPDFTISVPVSDSQGGQRTLQLNLLKSSTANTWNAELVASPASDVQDGAGLSNGQVATGALAFNSDGSIDMAASTLFQSGAFSTGAGSTSPTLNIGASTTTPAAGQVSWGSSLGVSAQAIALDVNKAPGGLSQYASASVTQSVETNGTQFGNLTSVDIDDQGFVTAVYDNGVSRQIAQVAVATFQNPDGLKSVSGDNYQVSSTSGTYNLKTAGSGGAGTISPSTLESSTVDLSQQFSGLIITQEAYSASTKILTTADQMLQSLISIKQ